MSVTVVVEEKRKKKRKRIEYKVLGILWTKEKRKTRDFSSVSELLE